MTHHPLPPHPSTSGPAVRRGRVGRIGVTVAVTVVAALLAGCVAVVGSAAWSLVTCDREYADLSRALPDDPSVRDLQARFPDHEDPETGCDEDDNTASAGVEFRTGLGREDAVSAAEDALTSNGWDEIDRTTHCHTKQIRGHQVYAQFPPPDRYNSPGTDLVISLSTGQCWPD